MTTSKIQVTEGSGKNIATHSLVEDAVTKEFQRVVMTASDGVDLNLFSTVVTGERAGSAAAVQLPDVAAKIVKIKAQASNAGNVYVGVAGVTKPDGTTDTTSGWELDAGQEIELKISNLNMLYIICDNAGDDIVYLVQR